MIWGFLLHRPVRRVLVAGFWSALVLVGTLTLLPAETLPPELFEFDLWDKVQHALAFTVLGLWGLLVYPLHPCACCWACCALAAPLKWRRP